MRSAIRSSVLLLVASASVALAQTPLVPAGSQVRVTRKTAQGEPLIGSIVAWRGDTLIVRGESNWGPSRGDHAVAVTDLQALEVPSARGGSSAGGAVVGGILGGLAGVAIGSAMAGDNSTDCTGRGVHECVYDGFSDALGSGFATIGLGLVGVVLGAVVGAEIGKSGSAWQKVALPGDTQRIALIRPGFKSRRLGLSIRM